MKEKKIRWDFMTDIFSKCNSSQEKIRGKSEISSENGSTNKDGLRI